MLNKTLEAINILKNKERVDPVKKAFSILLKAGAGEEAGSFRGGDPDELQRKKEEKREEMEESGEAEQQEEEKQLAIEDAGGESVLQEEAELAAEEAASKAMPWVAVQVSPVNTSEDYIPRNANGDPFRKETPPPYLEPAPFRPGKNQWKPWSEVVGIKIPLEGAPWAYLRRFYHSDKERHKVDEEQNKVFKSFDGTDDLFFEFYDNLNSDVTFDPYYRIHKAQKGEIIPGHKYIYRKKNKLGDWDYFYTNGIHPKHHGIEESAFPGGNTVPVHPEWHGENPSEGKDPLEKNPEAAFHFSRQKALEKKGNLGRVWVRNRDKFSPDKGDYENEPYILRSSGKGGLSLFSDPTEGKGEDLSSIKLKDAKKIHNLRGGWKGLEEHIRKQHVNTVYDVHGKPQLQYLHSKKPGQTQISYRYMPHSVFNSPEDVSDKFQSGKFANIDQIRDWARQEKANQARAVGMTFKPSVEHPSSGSKEVDILQGGSLPLEKRTVPFRGGLRQEWRPKWENETQFANFTNNIYGHFSNLFLKEAHQLVKSETQKRLKSGAPVISPEKTNDVARALATDPEVISAIRHTIKRYDPDKAAYSSYLMSVAKPKMKKILHFQYESEKGSEFSTEDQRIQSSLDKESAINLEKYGRDELDPVIEDAIAMKQKLHHTQKELTGFLEATKDIPGEEIKFARDQTQKKLESLKTHIPELEKIMMEGSKEKFRDWYKNMMKEEKPEKSQQQTILPEKLKEAYKSLRKADENNSQQLAQPEYIGRIGEPGAYKYLYESEGNIIHGTNAPDGVDEHNPGNGTPDISEIEPSPETTPQLFDEQGRKLFSSIPENAQNVEDNPNYSPNKEEGNHWAKKYVDPDTGSTRFIYFHRDKITDPKMHRNNVLHYVDAQLLKIREFYYNLLQSQNEEERELGLVIVLIDQGKVAPEDLLNLSPADVSVKDNVVSFSLKNGTVKISLDEILLDTLKALISKKEKEKYLFEIDLIELNQFFDQNFGVLPTHLEIYNLTKLFSLRFGKEISKEGTEFSVRNLGDIRHSVVQKMAEDLGLDRFTVEKYIDPIVVEALFLSAAVNRARLVKSNGVCEECKEPLGYCTHTRKNRKLHKAYKLQGRTEFQGIPISIENKKGSVRKWYDPNAKEHGETKMHFTYGYITNNSLGVDGDALDVYIGPDKDSKTVYIVHQLKKPEFKKYDEDKCMLGFNSAKEAKEAYLKQYNNSKFFGSMTTMPIEEFKEKMISQKGKMIKSFIWPTLSGISSKTPEEKVFSDWLKDYPIHEHHFHWNAFSKRTLQEEDNKADTGMPGTHVPELVTGEP